jgi:protein-tyrosine phosphatase
VDETARGAPEPFRLLYVCTGNICRSPFAQLHTRFLLDAWLGPAATRFEVASAGVGAVVGAGMHPLSREQLTTRRDHPRVAAFRARRLPEPEVAAADLVLTMNRHHRSRVLQDVPQALRSTFTLRELARLLDAVDVAALPADPVDRARALVPAALAARGASGPVPAEDDAVPDPIGGEAEAHADATRTIDAAVRRILGVVVPPVVAHRPVPRSPLPAPVPALPTQRDASSPRGVITLTPRPHPV